MQSLGILRRFIDQPEARLSGTDLNKTSHLPSGTLYPLLARLEHHGWLSSHWEDINPSVAGRPRKRLYWITEVGFKNGMEALGSLTSMSHGPIV